MKKFLCKIMGHDFRELTRQEIKCAVEELVLNKRDLEDLPASICRRCDLTFGFGVNGVNQVVEKICVD